jgi:putative transposase
MIEPNCRLSITRQCRLLGLSRSWVYHREQPADEATLGLMRVLDALHLDYPWMGSRSLRCQLREQGLLVSRSRVRRLMRLMGITAVYRKPHTTIAAQGHKVYPYLLGRMAIDRPNQVWAADMTYIPMARGFVYLVAIMDWHSRRVLAWRLSNTMTSDFCVEALEEAWARYGHPEIFNTDQGSQFTSEAFTGVLKAAGVAISMDGKGRWMNNVFIERLWRSVKYEEVYLHAYASVAEARTGLDRYFRFYKIKRTHQSLAERTPDAVYFNWNELRKTA